MSDSSAATAGPVPGRLAPWHRARGGLLMLMACLALVLPFFAQHLALFIVGLLLILTGVIELFETFQAVDEQERRSTYTSGVLSVAAGILLLAEPQVFLRGLALLVAASFLLDGLSKLLAWFRGRIAGSSRKMLFTRGLLNCALAVILAARWPVAGQAVVIVIVAIRMWSTGWSMLWLRDKKPVTKSDAARESQHPDRHLGLPAHQEFAKLQAQMTMEEAGRHRIDAIWCWTLVIVFFAIHIGRMRVPWDLVGMIAPLVAALGDVATALIMAFGLMLPYRMAWRKATRTLERRGWNRLLTRIDQSRGPGLLGMLSRGWLVGRFRFSR